MLLHIYIQYTLRVCTMTPSAQPCAMRPSAVPASTPIRHARPRFYKINNHC